MTESSTAAHVVTFEDEVLATARRQAARAESLGCRAEAARILRFVGGRTPAAEDTAAA